MNPVAFSIFGISIRWYGILIATGIAIGTFLATKEAKRVGYEEDDIIDLLLWTLPAAILGARLYYVAFSWQSYELNPIEILSIRNGGLAIHGGIIGAFSAGYLYVRKKRLSFFKVADIIAPSLILGQAIGRWGNFMNQEAHGGTVTQKFISHFPEFIQKQMYIDGRYYNPTFLYESIWNILVFSFLLFYRKRKEVDGELISLYFILYSLGRVVIEGLRTDSLMLFNIRIAQLISIVSICLGILLFVNLRIFKKRMK